MFDLTGRVVLVTGAGRGVGAGIARSLAGQGAAVAVNDVVAERADATATAIDAGGGRAIAAPFDVTDFDAVRAGVAGVQAALGPIDVLVNNAGVPDDMGLRPFRETGPEDWRSQVDLNVYGVMNCCRAVIDGMCERGFGRVITIASTAGTSGAGIGVSPYAAGKGGAIAFMRHLALESADRGVTANCVALGMMDNQPDDSPVSRLEGIIPVKRFGTPEDAGALCVYLASDEASWMTGQTLELNGGIHTT